MGWQAADGSWQGRTPGRDPGLPGPPGFRTGSGTAGFNHGGTWATAVPSAALAAALEGAAGPDDLYDRAETDALVGIARQWAALESWAAAGKLAALRARLPAPWRHWPTPTCSTGSAPWSGSRLPQAPTPKGALAPARMTQAMAAVAPATAASPAMTGAARAAQARPAIPGRTTAADRPLSRPAASAQTQAAPAQTLAAPVAARPCPASQRTRQWRPRRWRR